MIEQNSIENDGTDRQIASLLKREPVYRLSPDFERRVMSRLPSAESSRDMFWLWIGLVSILLSAVVAILLTGFKPSFGVFRFLSGHSGLFIFGIGFILALQWVERKFLRKHSF